jgi:ubiquinone/menaquinone biosynthesis C-methylase UbiE
MSVNKMLNIGCGKTYHDSWVNVDFVSTGPGVLAHNLLQGIPFPDSSFDVVYHSHVLEHFDTVGARNLVSECFRVLNSGVISLKRVRQQIAGWIVYLIAGKAAFKSFKMGIFRSGGEIHQWMYDRYSLKRLLEKAGFVHVKICAANESCITEFENYYLDVVNGKVRKPDSIYVEAYKP